MFIYLIKLVKMFNFNNKKWFTLVEMMIVVIIIGILMSALLPKLTWAQANARDTARLAAISQISTALTMYFNDAGIYPESSLTGYCAWITGVVSWWAFSDGIKQYMPEIPKDSQVKRKTLWTNTNGCIWLFAYTSIKNNWADSAWAILIANTESIWKNTNFILTGTYNFITWTDIASLAWSEIRDFIPKLYRNGTWDADTLDNKSLYLLLIY